MYLKVSSQVLRMLREEIISPSLAPDGCSIKSSLEIALIVSNTGLLDDNESIHGTGYMVWSSVTVVSRNIRIDLWRLSHSGCLFTSVQERQTANVEAT